MSTQTSNAAVEDQKLFMRTNFVARKIQELLGYETLEAPYAEDYSALLGTSEGLGLALSRERGLIFVITPWGARVAGRFPKSRNFHGLLEQIQEEFPLERQSRIPSSEIRLSDLFVFTHDPMDPKTLFPKAVFTPTKEVDLKLFSALARSTGQLRIVSGLHVQ